MCGIAGSFDASGHLPDRELLADMARRIEHRGPDEEGFLVQPGVGLVSRRLRIIDLEGGSQPIFNEDGSIAVVFNGEIYNFRELREDLEKKGHKFSTRADTEVLVHLYEDHGQEFLTPLRGMFAVALWDATRKVGILARDRLGKKPLVYAELGDQLYFASEMQALLPVPDLSREVDLATVGDYLEYGYIPAPATIFRSVRKLPPGHLLVWQAGDVTVKPYWKLDYEPKLQLTENEALDELERRLDEAVRLRLIADVPLGALLSGGVDSSTVVALMARHTDKVKTFSIGFDEPAFDELAHARRVAERYGTDHHEFVVQPEAADVLPLLVRHYGEPYADSSAVPSFYVSQLARQHVTVVLNGDGGDEAFAGYDRYRAVQLAEWVQRLPASGALISAGELLARKIPGARAQRRARRFLRGARLPVGQRYLQWAALLEPHSVPQLLSQDLAAEWHKNRSAAVERQLDAGAGLELVDRLLATDVATYLPFDLLVKFDIASMANSLETRSPLLDHEVVEFAARLPADMKLRHGWSQKYLLKRLARKLIPAENIDRPKMGFGVPVGKWFRGPLRELATDALLGSAPGRGFFNATTVEHLWSEHQAGSEDRTPALWSLLMFELWCREFLDAGRAMQPSSSRLQLAS